MAEEPGARHERPVAAAVPASEQLVPTADGEQRRSPGHRVAQIGALGREIRCNQRLLAILAATDVEKVVHPGSDTLAQPDGLDGELVPPQRRPAGEHGDVSSIGVDVEVLGIQVPDPDLHGVAPSQYGCTKPRSVRTARNASIAVYVGRMTSSVPASTSSRPRSSACSSEGISSSRSSGSPA